MITPSDPEYQATKRIVLGKARVEGPFDELSRWIASTWDVIVLNVIYDRVDNRPRLQVVLADNPDLDRFHDASRCNFDANKQLAIAEQFIDLVSREKSHNYDVERLLVVFAPFAPVAMEEADRNISDEQIEALKTRLGNPDLWTISRCFCDVTFMFYTDEQVAKHEASGLKGLYARKYLDTLKPFDNCGCVSVESFHIHFDSKQRFDKHYNGSWSLYNR